jgi:peptide/nickel transport system permease protein
MNPQTVVTGAETLPTFPARLASAWNSDLGYSFRHSPVAIVSAIVLAVCLAAALFAPWIAPHNPFDLRTLNLLDALSPPVGMPGSRPEFLLGTDDQGRDVLSAIMFGTRISLLVGLAAVALAIVVGVALGLIAGYAGGKLDAFIMRVADVQLSFPGDPDRAPDRRRRPRGAAARLALERRARRAGPRDRRGQLGTIRAYRARLDDGREE